jgi:predicted nucleotidyltransferase
VYSRADVIHIADRFIQLVSIEFPLRAAYLFGSYAKGQAAELSDIDLAIVSDKFEGSRFFDKQKINKILLSCSSDLEIHPFRTDDFTIENPFVKEIIENGIKLDL